MLQRRRAYYGMLSVGCVASSSQSFGCDLRLVSSSAVRGLFYGGAGVPPTVQSVVRGAKPPLNSLFTDTGWLSFFSTEPLSDTPFCLSFCLSHSFESFFLFLQSPQIGRASEGAMLSQARRRCLFRRGKARGLATRRWKNHILSNLRRLKHVARARSDPNALQTPHTASHYRPMQVHKKRG